MKTTLHTPSWSQSWLYEFYYDNESILSQNQKSILDHVLQGLGTPDQHIKESTATRKQKEAAVQIVKSVLRKCQAKHQR